MTLRSLERPRGGADGLQGFAPVVREDEALDLERARGAQQPLESLDSNLWDEDAVLVERHVVTVGQNQGAHQYRQRSFFQAERRLLPKLVEVRERPSPRLRGSQKFFGTLPQGYPPAGWYPEPPHPIRATAVEAGGGEQGRVHAGFGGVPSMPNPGSPSRESMRSRR